MTLTFDPDFKVTTFFEVSNIVKTAPLKDKVTIAQEETIPNIWNGTMFGDLDWLLMRRAGLSSSAEPLVFFPIIFVTGKPPNIDIRLSVCLLTGILKNYWYNLMNFYGMLRHNPWINLLDFKVKRSKSFLRITPFKIIVESHDKNWNLIYWILWNIPNYVCGRKTGSFKDLKRLRVRVMRSQWNILVKMQFKTIFTTSPKCCPPGWLFSTVLQLLVC